MEGIDARTGAEPATMGPVVLEPIRGELSARLDVWRHAVILLDAGVMACGFAIAWLVRELVPGVSRWSVDGFLLSLTALPAIAGMWFCALFFAGAYAKRTFGSGPDEFRSVAKGTVVAALLASTAAYFTQSDVPRPFLAALFLTGGALLLAQRWAMRQHLHRHRREGRLVNTVLLVGSVEAVVRMNALLTRLPHLGYRVVGCTVDMPDCQDPALPAPSVGSMSEVGATALALHVDTVLVAGGGGVELRKVGWELEGRAIDLVVVPHLADVAGSRMTVRPIGGLPLLHVEEPQALRAGEWPKRLFDVVVASVGLMLVLPVMVIAALMIKASDGGPVFFRQERVGRHGERFMLWKFRSMVVGADHDDAALRAEHGHVEGIFKLRQDPRVTRIGTVIRKYSIDELPQLFNVLQGTMSLVGPRPHRQHEVDTYSDAARRRLAVRPGMTGLWQVSGRSDLSWTDAVRMDLYYRDNWSLMWDVGIIAKTVKAVLARDGAY